MIRVDMDMLAIFRDKGRFDQMYENLCSKGIEMDMGPATLVTDVTWVYLTELPGTFTVDGDMEDTMNEPEYMPFLSQESLRNRTLRALLQEEEQKKDGSYYTKARAYGNDRGAFNELIPYEQRAKADDFPVEAEEEPVLDLKDYNTDLARESKAEVLVCPFCPPKVKHSNNGKEFHCYVNPKALIELPEPLHGKRYKDMDWSAVQGLQDAFKQHNKNSGHVPLFQGCDPSDRADRRILRVDIFVHHNGFVPALELCGLPYREFLKLDQDNDPTPLICRMTSIVCAAKAFLVEKLTLVTDRDTGQQSTFKHNVLFSYFTIAFRQNPTLAQKFATCCFEYLDDLLQILRGGCIDFRHLIESDVSPLYAWNALHLWLVEGPFFEDPFFLFGRRLRHTGVTPISIFQSDDATEKTHDTNSQNSTETDISHTNSKETDTNDPDSEQREVPKSSSDDTEGAVTQKARI
jgi:hypothetical protein